MASALKKFFEKKKLDNKFKQAGEGHSLTGSSSSRNVVQQSSVPQVRQQPSSSANRAGEAALARLQVQSAVKSKKPASKTATWKSQMRDEMEIENSVVETKPRPLQKQEIINDNVKTVDEGVLHSCPLCPAVLPYKQVEECLRQCLRKELDAEPLMISVTMIHTLNKDKTAVENCIKILCQYLQNIIDNKDEEKYRKIRKNNKAFQKKVSIIVGAEEFLTKGCGFEEKSLPFESNGETTDEIFYVLNNDLASNTEQLIAAKQMLIDAEPLKIELDRNMKLYEPSAKGNNIPIDSSFYNVTASEVKKEQIDRANNIDKMSQLRTKAMREADTPTRKYLYTVIRIRFPDGILLQGTFSASECLNDIIVFIKKHLQHDWMPFNLLDSIGKPLNDEKSTLATLKLVPSAILNISCDIANDMAGASNEGKVQYIKDEYLLHIQPL